MNNKISSISVVVLNYNGLKYLRRTILPLLNLDYPNYEIIVVDNGSTDGSREYVAKMPSVNLVISPKEREKNFACNYAIAKTRGDYILLLDNDVIITEKGILKNLIKRYLDNKKTGVIGLSLYNYGEIASKSYGNYMGYYYINEQRAIPVKDLKKHDNSLIAFPEGKALFIKKSIWKKVGGYDDHLKFGGDDSDLGIKLMLMGYKNYLYSSSVQIHIGQPERDDNKKYALKWKEMFYAHLYTIVKNYRFLNMIITLIGFSVFGFLKSVKQAIKRRYLRAFLSFFEGYFLFLVNLPVNIKKRRDMQKKRKIRKDIFLILKLAEFN